MAFFFFFFLFFIFALIYNDHHTFRDPENIMMIVALKK